jgi:serine protease inhibitor
LAPPKLMPVLRLSKRLSLPQTLSDMRMPTACTNGADFSGISASEQLAISDVIHMAFVEDNEKGTEAAAATAVIAVAVSARTETEVVATFRADHPFVFLLRDKHSGAFYSSDDCRSQSETPSGLFVTMRPSR